MANNDTLAAVRRFFDAVTYAGLVLPSGWFGRPYDNLLRLTRSEASERALVLELDGQLILTFGGEPEVTTSPEGLRLGGFSELVFDWTEFGSTVSHQERFDSGAVELVALMTRRPG